MVLGARQIFQIFRQKMWFLMKNWGLSQFKYQILHNLISITQLKNLSVKTSFKLTMWATLIARNYKPKVVEKYFSKIYKLSRVEARQIKPTQQANDRILFATTCNPMLPNMRNLIKKHLPVLHSDSDLKNIFSENSICTVFKRNKNLKEILSPSLNTKRNKKRNLVIKKLWKMWYL